jgi:hypothetical protein
LGLPFLGEPWCAHVKSTKRSARQLRSAPATSDGLRMLMTRPTKVVCDRPKTRPASTPPTDNVSPSVKDQRAPYALLIGNRGAIDCFHSHTILHNPRGSFILRVMRSVRADVFEV